MLDNHLHIAQFGAGHWGPNLVRNFMQLEAVRKFTLCDLDPASLGKVKKQFPMVKTTTDSELVFRDETIDALVIAVPAALHYEMAKRGLLLGKHVLVEKPLALKAEQAEDLIRISCERGKVIMVGHTFLYNAAVRKAKEYINKGELGDIYYIMAQRLNLGRVRQDVNAMWNLAPHDISIILYWLEEIPCRVSAKGLSFLQAGIEDVVFMDLEFPSGRAAHIHVSWLDPTKTRKLVVVGSRKMLVYDDVSADAKIAIYDKGIDKKNIIRELPSIEDYAQFHFANRSGDIFMPKIDFKEPLRLECQHFLESVIKGSQPFTDGQNGLEVTKILEKAQQCLECND
jgi:predicted dehydrogenase